MLFLVIFAASLCAASNLTFYAKVHGHFHRLNQFHTPYYEILTVGMTKLEKVPLFEINDGVAMTKDHSKVLGMRNGFLVLGTETNVTPLKLNFDENSRVLNLGTVFCKTSSGKKKERKEGLGVDLGEDFGQDTTDDSGSRECIPLEIYLLSSEEGEKKELGLEGRWKRDLKVDGSEMIDYPSDTEVNILILDEPPISSTFITPAIPPIVE